MFVYTCLEKLWIFHWVNILNINLCIILFLDKFCFIFRHSYHTWFYKIRIIVRMYPFRISKLHIIFHYETLTTIFFVTSVIQYVIFFTFIIYTNIFKVNVFFFLLNLRFIFTFHEIYFVSVLNSLTYNLFYCLKIYLTVFS